MFAEDENGATVRSLLACRLLKQAI